ncbi:unnamed protein product [Schistocephalus solidus]|uniref:Rad51 domain-containing protein n=1 Tax=Schistocephalus solidus TaxID=70667 RepID=A0A183SD72_SCHSO|nr:unnamed protein product [Schistocephalus solidus]
MTLKTPGSQSLEAKTPNGPPQMYTDADTCFLENIKEIGSQPDVFLMGHFKISGRLQTQSLLSTVFRGQIPEATVIGGISVEFLFNADVDYHKVLFDLICRCTLAPALGGLGQACVLLDTEATFSMLEFGTFIDRYLAANQLLDSVYVVSARTVAECILGLLTIRDLLKRTPTISLLLIDSSSACFGPYLPRKDWIASQAVFFDMLSHLTDHFSLSSVVCRLLASDQLPVDEATQEMLTINAHEGLFKYTRLNYGVKTAPSIFQQLMDTMLTNVPGTVACLEMLQNLDKVMKNLIDYGLIINMDKSELL